MDEALWRQVNIAYPGTIPQEREGQAADHLLDVLPVAEAQGLITSWFFIRKGRWRVRYRLINEPTHEQNNDAVLALLGDRLAWTTEVYEPEVHAFGGPESMDAAHQLFHRDSRQLLHFLSEKQPDRRERSLLLCSALMRSAGLDLHEQGDVWAQIAEQRASHLSRSSLAGSRPWDEFVNGVRTLLIARPRPDASHLLKAAVLLYSSEDSEPPDIFGIWRDSGELMTDTTDELGIFARRLEHLFTTVVPAHKRRYSNQDVADAINEAAGENVITQGYIWQLRKGQKDNPGYKHIAALAGFFGVPPQYFFDDPEAAALKTDTVRDVAFRAAGLSEPTLKAIKDMIDNARAMEGLTGMDDRPAKAWRKRRDVPPASNTLT